MTVRERLAAADRLQRTRMFKLIASALIVAIGLGVAITYTVSRARNAGDVVQVDTSSMPEIPRVEDARTPEEREIAEQVAAQRTAAEATARMLNDVLATRSDPTGVGVAVLAGVGLCLGVVWLGLGLTGLGMLGVVGVVALPLWIVGERLSMPRAKGLGSFIGAIGLLSFAFMVLIELLRASFSMSHPVLAIARNVVNEAVRLKVSLVFIVMLLFGLAALPGLLDESNPLRFRVQSFLQYGTSGAFALIAILSLFLAVGSVAFEQRDRVIWQTMTKPVRAWQYILGKWLGVSGVAAVLLGVSCAGVFLFVEYLREQPAMGEVRPFQAREGAISPDRFVLETQVLAARGSVKPIIPEFTPESLAQEVQAKVERLRADPNFRDDSESRQKIADELIAQRRVQFLTIQGGDQRLIRFEGLGAARDLGRPVTLRYKVSVGSDDPRYTHRLSFVFPNVPPAIQEVPLGQTMSLDVAAAAIASDGVLEMQVINGDLRANEAGRQTMSFAPEDGMEVFYSVGSYRLNFARAVLILWLKIAMLSMIGITAATCLSFSVASLVAFGAFFVAESAGFLLSSLEFYDYRAVGGRIDYPRLVVHAIATPIAELFRGYASVDPTLALVDGRLLGARQLTIAISALAIMTGLLYAAAVQIFRRRELATYSGQ